MHGSRKLRHGGWGSWQRFFLLIFINVFLSGLYGPIGSNCFSRGSVPEFLREPIATCDFAGGPDHPEGPDHLPPSVSAHGGLVCDCGISLNPGYAKILHILY